MVPDVYLEQQRFDQRDAFTDETATEAFVGCADALERANANLDAIRALTAEDPLTL